MDTYKTMRLCKELISAGLYMKPMLQAVCVRGLASSSSAITVERISENLSFRPAVKSRFSEDKRPIVLVYGWLVAKAQHIHKYGDFYLGKGFDVLHIKVNPLQLLWPPRAQSVISQIDQFVTSPKRSKQPIIIHGFSVGGYLYGETLLAFTSNPEKRRIMSSRVKGQIFDSPVDFEGVPRGVGMAVTPIWLLQKLIKFLLESYLGLFKKSVLEYYIRSSKAFYANPLRCPSLMFYSKTDVIGTTGPIESCIESWKKSGAPVYTKCWEESPHVEHFRYHPVEYIDALNAFIATLDLEPLADDKQLDRKLNITDEAAQDEKQPKRRATSRL